MERGDLIQFGPGINYSIWKGDTIDYLKVSYENRPAEIEAFKNSGKYLKELLDIYYE
jgi:hypothetical protein